MKILSAALLLSLAWTAAAAQDRAAEIDFENARAAAAAADRTRALQSALTAMNDGVEAGGAVTRLLEEQKVSVEFAKQAEPAKTVTAGGAAKILLSDALPAHPRAYAALIAAEAAKRMFADMPACAERSYMRGAVAARAFAELGGDFRALPAVDGDKLPAVEAAVAAWTTDAQTALHAAGAADGAPLLADLPDSPARAAADQRYLRFLFDERDARSAAVGR